MWWWGTARWAGPVRVQRTEAFVYRNLTRVALVKGALKGSARWTRAGPAQRAVPHPTVIRNFPLLIPSFSSSGVCR
jgi:hypothetical protein